MITGYILYVTIFQILFSILFFYSDFFHQVHLLSIACL